MSGCPIIVPGKGKRMPIFVSLLDSEMLKLGNDLFFPSTMEEQPYERLIQRIKLHLAPRKKVIPQRCRFLKRIQLENVSVSEYLRELRHLAMDCTFGEMLEVMLRDRFVAGIKSESLQKKLLQEDDDVTLDRVFSIEVSFEQAEQNAKELQDGLVAKMDIVPGGNRKNEARRGWQHGPGMQRRETICFRCGEKNSHLAPACPHKTKSCFKCKRIGHLSRVCKTGKSVPDCRYAQDELIYSVQGDTDAKINLHVDEYQLCFVVDTGSPVTLIPKKIYEKYWKDGKLSPSYLRLRSFCGNPIKIIGERRVFVKEANQDLRLIVVDEDISIVLLGREWLKGLNLDFSRLLNIRQARSLPFSLKEKVENEIDGMVNEGILQPIEYANWAAPIVPVLKKNGSLRICGDFRCTANKAIELDKYPLPSIDEIFSKLSGNTVFSSLDLSRAYLHVRLPEEAKRVVNINTTKGLFAFKRLPYGVAVAPNKFQREMDNLFADMSGVACYIDDILVAGKDHRDHEQKLELIFKRLQEKGYLHITTIADILAPLYHLLKKNSKWNWTGEHRILFAKCKALLTNESVLAHYDATRELVLACDASSYGLGVVLSHRNDGKEETPIAFASRTLTEAERRYSQLEKEALSIIFGCEKFRQYLLGREFVLITDNRPLMHIFYPRNRSPYVLHQELRDAYTIWLEIVIIKDITSRTIIGHLREIFARFGLPELLVTDNGRQFVSSEFEEFTKINSISHTKASPYNPSTNGLAERYVREFKNSLRKNQGKDSVEIILQRFLFAHRAFPQTVLKESPAELLMKINLRSRFSNLIPKMAKVGEVYHDAMRKQKHFAVGSDVYFRSFANGPKWKRGRIMELLSSRHYLIEDEGRYVKRHINQLRPVIKKEVPEVRDLVLSGTSRDFILPGTSRDHPGLGGQEKTREEAPEVDEELKGAESSAQEDTPEPEPGPAAAAVPVPVRSPRPQRSRRPPEPEPGPAAVPVPVRTQNQALQAQNQETREAFQAQHQELKESLGLKFKCLEDGISSVKEEMKDEISSVKEEMKDKISALEERLAAVETGHPGTPVFQQENNNSEKPSSDAQKSKRADNVLDHLQQVWEETKKELQPGQQRELATLLATYGNIFAKSSEDYGKTDLTKYRINTGESNPIKQAPHRIPLARRQEAETLVEEMMLDRNIIEPFSSPWVSPVVLVKKKDGSTRFCVDYRKLNDITKKDSYPFPRIDATLDTLAGSQWFSTLDLKIPLEIAIAEFLKEHQVLFNDTAEPIKGFTFSMNIRDVSSIFHKARPVPFAIRTAVTEALENMVTKGHLYRVRSSQWKTPVVVVPKKKKNKEMRICCDFKVTLNRLLDTAAHPLPTQQDLFAILAKGKYFSKLDLSSAYLQLEVAKSTQPFLTINTHKGFFRFRRMPFGLANAPSYLQSVMDRVLARIEGVICYIDDVLIATVSVKKHLAVLKTVFLRLEKYNIKLKKDKCKFVQREIEYLGHLIKEDGIRPLDHKVQALQKAKSPTNISELRSFLELVNYYGKFIPNLPDLLSPLHELLHKNNCWSWTKECEEAIEKCKSSITSERVLVPYDTTLPLFLATDASQIGIGAVLSHVIGGQERPIMFASWTLSGAERNYSQIEREALAIIYEVTKFHQFIYGRRFTLITDHKPIVSILGPKSGIPTLDYRDGRKFFESGETSRLDNIYALSYMEDLSITTEEIKIETQKDEVLSIVKCYTQHGWPERVPDHLRPYFQRKMELTVDGECILWGMRVIIPSSLRPNLLSCLHETHSGMSKMKSVARSHFWWPNLDNEIEFLVNRFRNCQQVQDGPNRVKWQPWIWAVRPWQRIHIDYAKKDNINLLIVVDSHSKWIEAFPMREITSAKTIEQLRRLFSSYGLPEEIASDNGPQFTGSDMKTFLKNNGIKHTLIPAYYPQSNGLAERAVKMIKMALDKNKRKPEDTIQDTRSKFCWTLTQQLTMFVNKIQRDWDQHLPMLLMAYRSAEHESTGYSQIALFGHELRMPCDVLLGRPEETIENTNKYISHFEERMLSIHQWAREKLHLSSEKMKDSYNVKTSHKTFKEGEMVWLHNPQRKKGLSPKLQYQWEVPTRSSSASTMSSIGFRRPRHLNPKWDEELMQESRRTKLRVLQASCCLKRSDCCLPPTPVYFLEDSKRFYELLFPVLLLLSLTVL
ncbi:K02A2.6-like, partial [Cordylochernes scorpioides]